jgi:hypothetical protein
LPPNGGGSAIFLQTARSIAQDQSLGQTAILKKLNTVDIFQRAAEIAAEKEAIRHTEFEALAEQREKEIKADFDAQLVKLAEGAEKQTQAPQRELSDQLADAETPRTSGRGREQ